MTIVIDTCSCTNALEEDLPLDNVPNISDGGCAPGATLSPWIEIVVLMQHCQFLQELVWVKNFHAVAAPKEHRHYQICTSASKLMVILQIQRLQQV